MGELIPGVEDWVEYIPHWEQEIELVVPSEEEYSEQFVEKPEKVPSLNVPSLTALIIDSGGKQGRRESTRSKFSKRYQH